jgi:predicted signal transduction protein with EAL and GGDEF domain
MELARSLQMDVVAEGVETEDQFQQLAALGCQYVQGYYFSKPVSAPAAQILMVERDRMQRSFAVLQGAALQSAALQSVNIDAGDLLAPNMSRTYTNGVARETAVS